jgi:hypothetical protein
MQQFLNPKPETQHPYIHMICPWIARLSKFIWPIAAAFIDEPKLENLQAPIIHDLH